MVKIRGACALILITLIAALPVQAEPLAKQLFGVQTQASQQKPEAIGYYSQGCMAGGVQLAETGPTWQAMRLSRNRNWGLPILVDYIQDLSAFTAKQPGWSGLYVGDMQQPRGGPMLTGHVSHQSGLDVDVWMRPADDLTLSRQQRETISSISMQRAGGAYVNSSFTRAHHEILKAAAKDRRTARIFVFAGAKVQMCKDAKGDRRWLRKIRPWKGHHYHFHIRLKCPRGMRHCEKQKAPPRGDGCEEAESWVRDILNPQPKPKVTEKTAKRATPTPRSRNPRLADLPKQCAAVLRSR